MILLTSILNCSVKIFTQQVTVCIKKRDRDIVKLYYPVYITIHEGLRSKVV